MSHPRDRFITVYGRKPVLEALEDRALRVDKLLVAHNAKGAVVQRILAAATERGIGLRRLPAKEVSRISRHGRQDQGVALDVEAPHMGDLLEALSRSSPGDADRLLVLDGITTPANLGMILRSAHAAGLGVVLPRKGASDLNPLVLKASAGTAFRCRILRCARAEEGLRTLREAGFRLLGLAAEAETSLFETELPERCALVLGNESEGLSPAAEALLHERVRIPMRGDTESLNVACAATLAAYRLAGLC